MNNQSDDEPKQIEETKESVVQEQVPINEDSEKATAPTKERKPRGNKPAPNKTEKVTYVYRVKGTTSAETPISEPSQ